MTAHPDVHVPLSPPALLAPRRWTALALICAAQFMLILDVTVVNVALPAIADDLGLGRTELTWVVAAYTLCFGGLMLLGGRLADTLGARRTLLAGLALFTAASLTCGLATGAVPLIAGRVAQGIGAALLSPAALALVATLFHGPERTRALGIWAAIGATGSAIGVLVGGALTDGPGWSWIFYVNVPVGAALLVALPRVVPAVRPGPAGTAGVAGAEEAADREGAAGAEEAADREGAAGAEGTTDTTDALAGTAGGSRRAGSRRPRPDLPGALLVTAATGSLVYGLIRAGDAGGWVSPAALLPLLGSLALYGLFAAVEKASPAPLMDPRTLTRRPVVAGSLLMLVATALLISFFFLGSVLLQHVHHFSALRTGLLFLPVALTTAVGAHLGSRLVAGTGPRALAAAGTGLAALAVLPLTLLPADANPWTTLLPALSVAALGLGAVFVTATTTALGLTAPHEAGLASGIVNTFHELGGSLGVAAVSTLAAPALTGTGTPGSFTAAFTLLTATAALTALAAPALVPKGTPRLTGGPHAH
ncbi:MFS transporter [Streptomyces sp. NPDC046371]|uniref:MFS transporter n=1 Tax=Streptomyces sp. NPDC046371 TaxID=3154916 RepID=UPI0033E7FC3D